jgi:membrane protein implicated in regulation of membrane protease activity
MGGSGVQIWFWAWLLLTAILAVVSFFDRERYILPWAVAAAAATVLVGLFGPTGWEWVALLGLSTVLLVAVQRFRAPGRKSLQRARRAEGHTSKRAAS